MLNISTLEPIWLERGKKFLFIVYNNYKHIGSKTTNTTGTAIDENTVINGTANKVIVDRQMDKGV